ncbi:hypothetical protein [Roseovarius salinarum]|uniref:hypothetical protein n=1 Tax=Roseovarius salinarum TaxID=1981892 RepID=UPI000C340021|nr:hypothetical protein [Roseovarius salinarum]
MKKGKWAITATVTMLLAGCMSQQSDAPAGAIESRIVDRTLVADRGFSIIPHSGGRLSGKIENGGVIAGTWDIRDGRWCRMLTKPENQAGRKCQDITMAGDTVTVTSRDGTVTRLTIQ